jgi:DNA-directed RNA polymerase subunit RPC12/RpoP
VRHVAAALLKIVNESINLGVKLEMRNFIRKKEDFECEHCGEKVMGDGYTDHCPKCLWGKHVDLEIPGDRASECRGMMEPIEVKFQISNFKFQIKYKCLRCNHTFEVGSAKGDNRELLVSMVK